jgi:hypothetical protein
MDQSLQLWRKRITEAQQELDALPRLAGRDPQDTIQALIRAHLELTARANEGKVALPLDCPNDKQRARTILEEYRDQILDRMNGDAPKVFLHSDRMITGMHGVSPQLSFLSEVSIVREPSGFDWRCQSKHGYFEYSAGPVVTHVTTLVHEAGSQDIPRTFSMTPLFSAAAFEEDIDRILQGGALLALGMGGKPSYILCSVLNSFHSVRTNRAKFEPGCIGHIDVSQINAQQVALSLRTTTFGTLHCLIVHNEYGDCLVSAEGTTKLKTIPTA